MRSSGSSSGRRVNYLISHFRALFIIILFNFSRDQYMGFNDLNRPPSGLSFFPTLSFAHSLPPLGEWCREVVRSHQWNRDIMVKENRNKSARRRLSRISEVWVLNLSYGWNGQQTRRICFATLLQTSWKAMLRVLPPTFKPVLQQTKLLQVAWILTSDWIKLRGSHAIRGIYVTCCNTSLPWASKTRNMYRFCSKK